MEPDKISMARIALLHPDLRKDATDVLVWAWENNIRLRYTFTLRTFAEQDALYAQGRTKPGKIVTNAKGGRSYHNYGLALDIALMTQDNRSLIWDTRYDGPDEGNKADWLQVAEKFESLGWEWGGRWKKFVDLPHFQKTGGKSLSVLLTEYKNRGGKPY